MSEQQQSMNGNLADSIAMLEQILEVMPQDGVALKAVYSAYLKNGNTDRAFDYLSRLVDVAIGGETELMGYVQDELQHFQESHPAEVAAHNARLRTLASDEQQADPPPFKSEEQEERTAKKYEVDISEELALAWKLYEESQLSQEEYSSVLHDLTEVSSKELDVPASVLHVLHDRGFSQMSRIMNYMSNRSGVPFIVLSFFELGEGVASALPESFPIHEGALPFAFLGNDLLVGVLNPFNHTLVERVETESGHRCHTYLVDPEDYDIALGKLRGLMAKAA